ncbi:macrophage mannose receptor 1-like [Watersipora subatra]|uniref:macrophage mannose receptor 1-like n=1 Tax=Watersipora subatra TaxID=2589382 RepID=UPI00355BAE4C
MVYQPCDNYELKLLTIVFLIISRSLSPKVDGYSLVTGFISAKIRYFNYGNGYLCPPGWLTRGDNCYFISRRNSLTKSWHQASLICNQLQADLLSIESQDEYDWLSHEMNERTEDEMVDQRWWIGLNDEGEADNWVWSTGKNETFSPKWVDGYPKNHSGKACGQMKCNRCALINTRLEFVPGVHKNSYIRGLTEQSCLQKNPYICKRSNITELPSKCDYGDGWLEVGNACWKLFTDNKQSWYEARDHCEQIEEGRLASVHTFHDQTILLTVANDNFDAYWIGLQINKVVCSPQNWLNHQRPVDRWKHFISRKTRNLLAAQQPDYHSLSSREGCVYVDNTDIDVEGWHLGSCDKDLSFICQRPQGDPHVQSVCPSGWVTLNGRCYEFRMRDKQSWMGAKKSCMNQNATLMQIDSPVEKDFITKSRYFFDLDVGAIWMGFSAYLEAYRWLSGDVVNSSLIVIPDNLAANNPQCGLVYTDNDGKMTVTDNCANRFPYICEAAATDSVIEYHHPPVDTFCEPDYYQYRGRCYKMNSAEKSYNDAQKACSDVGATLATPSNSQEQAFINSHTTQIYWIGLTSWGKTENWKWVDGSPTEYRNFISNYHGMLRSGSNCVFILGKPGRNKGQWTPGVCASKFAFICEKPGSKFKVTTTPLPAINPECGEGWRTPVVYAVGTHLNYCYQLNEENRVWSEAEADCKTKGGQLASVTSPYEQIVIESYIPYKLPGVSMWIGGSDMTSSSAWGWADSSIFSYINWDDLNTHSKSHVQCLTMNLETKKWFPEDCNKKKSYMCKRPKINQPTTTTPLPQKITTLPPGTKKTCPQSYRLVGSNCYKVYRKAATQQVAKDTCKQDSAFLASVKSELENINELKAIHKHWIGLEDRDLNGVFTWTDGTPVAFVDWGFHQPTQTSYLRCVVMNEKGFWDVMLCENLADGFICKMSATLVGGDPTTDMAKLCPPMTTHMTDTTCYLATYSQFVWETAKESCKVNKFDLAWLESPEEVAYILDIYRHTSVYNLWLGYTNINGKYLWNTAPVDIDDYLPQWNKDHTGNEFGNCTYLKVKTGELYDGDCDTRQPYICKEYRMDFVKPPRKWETACPNQWHLVGNKCYLAFQSFRRPAKKSWYQAKEHCEAFGGDLASLHAEFSDDASLEDIFSNQFGQVQKSDYWIGLNRLDKSIGYQWSDGSNVDMTPWAYGEPNDHQQLESCVVASTAAYGKPVKLTFNDKYCHTANDYVCQLPAGTIAATVKPTTILPTPSRIPGVQGKCDPGWLEHAKSCYKFKTDYMNWHEAKRDCENETGHLVVIKTREDNDFIVSQITQSSTEHWAIGLTEFGGEKWGWLDGSDLDFAPWHIGEPSDHGGSEGCAEIYQNSGFWNDYNCGLPTRGHICQRPLNGITLPPTTTASTMVGDCQKNFHLYDYKCFGMFGQDAPLAWQQAQAKCRTYGKGYDLASVVNARQQALVGLVTYKSNLPVWIGLSDLTGFGRFTWSNNEPKGSSNWGPGQPITSYNYKNGRCVQLETDVKKKLGLWKTAECTEKLPYLCSGPPDPSLPAAPTKPSAVCHPGYREFNGQCYKIFTSPLNFEAASRSCYRDGMGQLTSVLDAGEQSFLEVFLTLSDLKLPDVWIGMKRVEYKVDRIKVGQYEWADRYPVTFSQWMPGQPKHEESVPNCVAMNASNGGWSSLDCSPSIVKPYICKISSAPLPTRSPSRYLCENPLAIGFRDMCYTFHTPKYRKPWNDASAECAREGMTIASIHNADTQQFMTGFITYTKIPMPMWIGLVKSNKGE